MTKSKTPLTAGKLLILVILLLMSASAFAQVDTAWVRKYNGPGDSSDEAYDLETDFSISVIPDTLWVSQGNSGNYKIILTSINGFASFCTLTVVGYPNGATATFNPPKLVPTDSSTLTLTIPANAVLDTLTLTITATEMEKGKGIAHSKDVTLIVTLPTWAFKVDAFPDTQTISPGGSTPYWVTILPNQGFTMACTLFVEFVGGLPSGVTADFDSNPIPPNDTSTLTITTSLSTPPDTYDLAIIAVANKKQKDTTYVKLIIEEVPTTGTISGNVEDASSQQNLQDVLVEALQESLIVGSDYSGVDGNYSIPNLPAGFYNVRAQKPGYETKTYNGVQVTAGQTTTQDFNLNPSPADTVFYDDFSDGNADGWDTLSRACDWSVPAGQYILTVPGEHRIWCFSSRGDINLRDYIYEADVYGIHGVDKVICFRFIDKNNFYAVNLRSDWGGNDEVTINKMQGEELTADIFSVSYPSQNQTLYHLKVEVSGTDQTNIKVWVDDNQLINWTDPGTPITHGKIAVAAYSGDYGSSTGLPTVVGFTDVLVACPSYDLTVDIREDILLETPGTANDTTYWFMLPFSVKNNGPATLQAIEVQANIGGTIFTHTIPSLGPGLRETLRDTIVIPPDWGPQNLIVSVTSVAGCPVDFSDTKEVSVYYCTGGSTTNPHPYDIFQDSYHFINPHLDWETLRDVFQDPSMVLTSLINLIYVFNGACFGMAASSNEYFINPNSRPVNKITHEMDLTDYWVLESIVYYHLSQYFLGHFYESFVYLDPNESETIAKELLRSNQPVVVAFRQEDGGHAVSGYKMLRDITENKTLLYLYDNEQPGTVRCGVFDLDNHTFNYGDWNNLRVFRHFECLSISEINKRLPDAIKGIAETLWQKGKTLFSDLIEKLPFPKGPQFGQRSGVAGRMLVTDQYGRRVGFVDGEFFVNEIPTAEVLFADLANGDTVTYYQVPHDLNYTVQYFAFDSGEITAEVLKPTSEKTALTLAYIDIPVTQGLMATLQIDTTYNYTLNIDEDGDGTVDTILDPTVENIPPTLFDLLSPSDQGTVSLYPFVFNWLSSTDLNGDTISYQVYVDMDSSFSSADSSGLVSDTSWICTIPLRDSTTYFWKVKVFDTKGGVTVSEQTWSFFLVLPFIYGDANGDGVINVTDVVYLINYLFIDGPVPDPIQAGDINCDGFVNVTDVVYLINYLFIDGPAPCR